MSSSNQQQLLQAEQACQAALTCAALLMVVLAVAVMSFRRTRERVEVELDASARDARKSREALDAALEYLHNTRPVE